MSTHPTNNDNHEELVQDQQQQDSQHLERQIQFQRALERNLRSYIEYAQQQKKLHYIHIIMLILSIYQIVEIISCGVLAWVTYKSEPLFSLYITSVGTNLFSMLPLCYYSYLIHQNEIQFLIGLLWFQYDIEQKPNFGVCEIMQKSNCICKYLILLSISLQMVLLGVIVMSFILLQSQTSEQPLLVELTLQMMIITRILLVLFFIIICCINSIYKKEYSRIYNQIITLQESEYEQFSPLNKYPAMIVNSETEQQLSQVLCIICLHGFVENEEYIKLQCHPLHIFHQKCLSEWIGINQTCPTCRTNI